MYCVDFHPNGNWIATASGARVSTWIAGHPRPHVINMEQAIRGMAFPSDWRWIAMSMEDGTIGLWSWSDGRLEFVRTVYRPQQGRPAPGSMAADPRGRFLAISGFGSEGSVLQILSLEDGSIRELPRGTGRPSSNLAVDPRGRYVAVAWSETAFQSNQAQVSVHDLQSGTRRVLDPKTKGNLAPIRFLPDGRLIGDSFLEIRSLDIETGETDVFLERCQGGNFVFSRDGRYFLTWATGDLCPENTKGWVFRDLEAGTSRELPEDFPYPRGTEAYAIDPDGKFAVSGYPDGAIRVMYANGGHAHLLMGHEGPVTGVAVDPSGRWIVSKGADKTLRIWPVPEGEPIHQLPHEELLARLRALTNMRVVPDETSSTGYKVALDGFPGWEKLPTW